MWIKKLKNAAAIAAAAMALMGGSFILLQAFPRTLRSGPPPGAQGVAPVAVGAGSGRRQESGLDEPVISGATSRRSTWAGMVEP